MSALGSPMQPFEDGPEETLDLKELEEELSVAETEYEAAADDVPLVLLPESEPLDGVLAASEDDDDEEPLAAAAAAVPEPRESVR